MCRNVKNNKGDYMKHEVNLENYQIHTDLAIDVIDKKSNLKGVKKEVNVFDNITVTDVCLDSVNSLNKSKGNYITIEFDDITDSNNYNNVKKVVIKELNKILKKMHIKKNDKCLFIGLGNIASTPDSLGPKVKKNIIVTSHIYKLGTLDSNYRVVSAISPGVMGTTGIETHDIIESIVKTIKPDFIIAVDALASESIDRLNKTIQMTDTGIHPGSGIGNERRELSYNSLNVPVLAIGVPTVASAAVIVSDTINYMYKHYEFNKEYIKNPKSKLTFNNINYLNKNITINKKDKEELFGIIGMLNEDEIKSLMSEVLNPIGYNLMVTPKEIDFVIDRLSTLIATSLNETLHNINY